MTDIVLERFAYTSIMGVFGLLRIPEFQCYTVECPWLDNRPWVSCVPEGRYSMRRSRFNRGGYDCYQLEVDGRSRILIHVGNTINDLRGCIAPGEDLGYVAGKWAVMRSRSAFKQMMLALDHLAGPLTLQITHATGGIRHERTEMEPAI